VRLRFLILVSGVACATAPARPPAPIRPAGAVVVLPGHVSRPDRWAVSFDGSPATDALQQLANATHKPVRSDEVPRTSLHFRYPPAGSGRDAAPLAETVAALRSELERAGWTFEETAEAIQVHRVGVGRGAGAPVLVLPPQDPRLAPTDLWALGLEGEALGVMQQLADATGKPVRAPEVPSFHVNFRYPVKGAAPVTEVLAALRTEIEHAGWTFEERDDAFLMHRTAIEEPQLTP
jgi:hypothetical protein